MSFSELPNKELWNKVGTISGNDSIYDLSNLRYKSDYEYFAPLISEGLFVFSNKLKVINNNALYFIKCDDVF
ncbi:hypothetical protein C942_02447 [Photobacterium marinum]|uniref:Uncharacterized protein n=1 Tax=Photobacterium marinum TaxID=1056511 RepID=L8JA46_9GAMM|nr:hypothetical protein C942_02447 [Photobacterium marinum]